MDLSKLTLAEIESLAERLGDAANTIRSALALMGNAPLVVPAASKVPPASLVPGEVYTNVNPSVAIDPADLEERKRLMRQFAPGGINQGAPADEAMLRDT